MTGCAMRGSLRICLLVALMGLLWPLAEGLASPVELVGRDPNGNWMIQSGELLSPDKLGSVSLGWSGAGERIQLPLGLRSNSLEVSRASGQIQLSLGASIQARVGAMELGPIFGTVLATRMGHVTLVEREVVAPPPAPAVVTQHVDPAGNPARDNRLMVFGVFSRAQSAPPDSRPGILVGTLTGTIPEATGSPEGPVPLGTQPPLANPVPASVWLFLTGLGALGWARRKILNGSRR